MKKVSENQLKNMSYYGPSEDLQKMRDEEKSKYN